MTDVIKIKPKIDKEKVADKVVQNLKGEGRGRLYNSIYDDEYWKQVQDLKKEYSITTNGFSKGRTRRHIASVPIELYRRAKQMYGEDVFTNKEKFKKLFLKEDVGEWTLLVPKNTI